MGDGKILDRHGRFIGAPPGDPTAGLGNPVEAMANAMNSQMNHLNMALFSIHTEISATVNMMMNLEKNPKYPGHYASLDKFREAVSFFIAFGMKQMSYDKLKEFLDKWHADNPNLMLSLTGLPVSEATYNYISGNEDFKDIFII